MLGFFKNSSHLFNRKQEDILSAAFLIAVSVAVSRILGLVRYRLLASYFGDDIKLLDSFIAASILPDAIFEVLIFGTIALAFIPIFSQYLSRDNLEKAWQLSSTMISISLLIFAVLTIVIMVFASPIASIIAPGLVDKEPTTQVLIARLLRIMLIAQLFFVVSIFFTGILQSFQRFLVPATASIFYNLGIIISIIFLAPVIGIHAPALGMILGALLHMVVQLPLVLSLGFKFRFNFDYKIKDVREMFLLMWPRSITLGLTRLSELINIALASIAALGSIVAFNFAQILQLVPIAFFASPISQAALPTLSIHSHTGKSEQFKKLFTESFHQILFLILPAAAILAILRIPVVRLVFGARQFPWEITVLTGRVLIAFSIGISAQAISLLLTRSFYALKDSATPVKVSIVAIGTNIALSFIFIFVLKLSIIYLAIAYSVGQILNALGLLIFLYKKVDGFDLKLFFVPVFKMGSIAIATAIS
ncbi:murein biosynthesis integral membrane protein MurJ, partial [Candidatus Curtissbacteria bacterium]|nr:murein biosynthesis integral membrane protein MurJ [Candidatus Curtissbacteria bacterium]